MKKYTFVIYYFDEKTKEVTLKATMKTKPILQDRLQGIIDREVAKAKSPCCYQIITKDFR